MRPDGFWNAVDGIGIAGFVWHALAVAALTHYYSGPPYGIASRTLAFNAAAQMLNTTDRRCVENALDADRSWR